MNYRDRDREDYGYRDRDRDDYENWRNAGHQQGWFDRAREEVRRWFGMDEDTPSSRPSGYDRGRRYGQEYGGGFARPGGAEADYVPYESLRQHEPGMPYEPLGGRHETNLMEDRYGGIGRSTWVRSEEPNRSYGRPYGRQTYGSWGPIEHWTNRRDTEYGGYGYSGRGPRNYQRNDERIREDVIERLTDHPGLDASDIEVRVESGDVILSGMVDDRRQKRMAADICEDVFGVRNVQNQLRVRQMAGFNIPRRDENSQPVKATNAQSR